MRRPLRLITTAAASLALLTTPVLARDHHRGGWNDRGWHDRGWDRRHRDNGVSAGDVIAGVAVIGAVAAIAGVFDGGNDRENEPVPVRYPEQDSRGYAAGTGSGLDSAVDICVAEIEPPVRVSPASTAPIVRPMAGSCPARWKAARPSPAASAMMDGSQMWRSATTARRPMAAITARPSAIRNMTTPPITAPATDWVTGEATPRGKSAVRSATPSPPRAGRSRRQPRCSNPRRAAPATR